MTRELLGVLIGGVTLGSSYAVMAIGMSLVYGVSKVFNFAYGSFFIWGAYFAWLLISAYAGISYPATFAIVISIMFGFGLLAERFIISPLRRRADWQVTTMMITLGLALFLDNTALVTFGPLGFKGNINLGGMTTSVHEIGVLVFAVSIMIGLELFLTKTRMGLAMRAVAQDMVGAQIVGISAHRMFGYAFAIAVTLAGVAGILLSPKYFIFPLAGWDILVKAWVIVVLGGLGSIRGTLYSAFILGVAEAIVCWQFGGMWVMVFWFSILLGILTVRPGGLFGTSR
jgi:branched-chain amino acid transport system permease protein